jgi:Restriction endonuclease
VQNTTWQTFEQLALQIQRDLSPDAAVTHNEKLLGKSGAEHQCDGVLRASVGQLEFVCVLECKDRREPVGSEVMRAFVGKIADLRVHQGIIISASGFTSDALKLAREHSITAYKLIDAQHIRWRHEALLPLVFIGITIERAESKFLGLDGSVRKFFPDGAALAEAQMSVLDRKTGEHRTVRQVLEDLWDSTLDERIPTPDHHVQTELGRFAFFHGGRYEDVVIQAAFTSKILYHYNTVSAASLQGFVDEQSGTLLPSRYETAPLDTHVITKEWSSTTDKAAVPFLPVDHLYLCGFFHRQPRTPRHFTLGRTVGPPDGDAIIL